MARPLDDVYRTPRLEQVGDGIIFHETETHRGLLEDVSPFLELHPQRPPRLRLWEGRDAIDEPVAFTRVIVRTDFIELELTPDAREKTRVRMLGLDLRDSATTTATVCAMLARFLPPDIIADGPTHAARAAAQLRATSPRERTLRAAVLAAPDDDTARRVLADHWLELGDPRGELIALQCEPCTDPSRRRELDRRLAELLHAHEAAWLAPYDLAGVRVTWRRGFVEHVETTAYKLLEGWRELVDDMPVRQLSVWSTDNAGLGDLLSRPWPACITRLTLFDMRDLEHIEHLIASPALPQLEKIYLSTPDVVYDDSHLDRLVTNGRALRELGLRGGDFSTPALARALDTRSWRELSLPYCNFDATAGEAFAAATNLVELASLCLDGNPLGDDGVAALAGAANLVALRELFLHSTGVGPRGIRALAACRALRSLALDSNTLTVTCAEALATLPGGQLRELRLYKHFLDDNEGSFGDDGVHALATSEALAGLELLEARQLGLSGDGARALLGATRGALAVLDLAENPLGASAVRLLEAPELATLHTLRLSETACDVHAVEALAARTDLIALRELDLDSNPIGTRGAHALAVAPWLDSITKLELRGCDISESSRAALVARLGDRVEL